MRALRAFTIVELLTALVLLAVGLAAFARAAGAVARLESDARLRRLVAAAIQARLDSLAGQACDGPRAGEAQHDGLAERWHAEPQAQHLRLEEHIEVPARPALSRSITATIACAP